MYGYDEDDSLNYGMLGAAQGLLTPPSRGGGLGAAFGNFGKIVANQRNISEQQELTKLKIAAYKKNLKDGIEEGDPAAWREWTRFSKLSPEQQQAYLDLKRQNYDITKFGDVPAQVRKGPGATPQMLSTPEAIGESMRTTAQMKEAGTQEAKAAYDLLPGVDDQNRSVFGTRLGQLGMMGNKAPGVSAPQPFNSQAHRFPPGTQPNSTRLQVLNDELANEKNPANRAAIEREIKGLSGGLGGAFLRPEAAGAAAREGEKAGAKGTAEMYTEMSRAAVDAQEANRALDKISAFIEKDKVTGGPLAKPEVWARNALSEFGIPLNGALDTNNAKLSAIASQRLAAKIMKGGRSLTDTDVRLIASAFPGFDSGIPFAQLPAFIETVRAMNNDSIDTWKRHSSRMTPEMRQNYPAFDEPVEEPQFKVIRRR